MQEVVTLLKEISEGRLPKITKKLFWGFLTQQPQKGCYILPSQRKCCGSLGNKGKFVQN